MSEFITRFFTLIVATSLLPYPNMAAPSAVPRIAGCSRDGTSIFSSESINFPLGVFGHPGGVNWRSTARLDRLAEPWRRLKQAGSLFVERHRGLPILFGPIGNLPIPFGRYAIAIRQMINPSHKGLVGLYGGSGADVTSFLLATDAVRGYFVTRNKVDYSRFLHFVEGWDLLEESSGANDEHRKARGFDRGETLWNETEVDVLKKLKALGIKKEDLSINLVHNYVRLQFPWKYPGAKSPVPRTIVFIAEDITNLGRSDSIDPLLRHVLKNGIDVYYQRAGMGIPRDYETMLPIIAESIRNGGYSLTDDHDGDQEQTHFYDPMIPLNKSQHRFEAIPPSKNLEQAKREIPSSTGYGWEQTVAQKAGVSSEEIADALETVGRAIEEENRLYREWAGASHLPLDLERSLFSSLFSPDYSLGHVSSIASTPKSNVKTEGYEGNPSMEPTESGSPAALAAPIDPVVLRKKALLALAGFAFSGSLLLGGGFVVERYLWMEALRMTAWLMDINWKWNAVLMTVGASGTAVLFLRVHRAIQPRIGRLFAEFRQPKPEHRRLAAAWYYALPWIIAHEFGHYLAGKLLRLNVVRVQLLPKIVPRTSSPQMFSQPPDRIMNPHVSYLGVDKDAVKQLIFSAAGWLGEIIFGLTIGNALFLAVRTPAFSPVFSLGILLVGAVFVATAISYIVFHQTLHVLADPMFFRQKGLGMRRLLYIYTQSNDWAMSRWAIRSIISGRRETSPAIYFDLFNGAISPSPRNDQRHRSLSLHILPGAA